MEEHERRKDSKELYMWMGKTTQCIENIEQTATETKATIKEIRKKVDQPIICPYKESMKYIYGAIGLLYAAIISMAMKVKFW